MKAILLIDIPDDVYDCYQNWSVTSNDEIELRYEEDGSLMHFMNLGMNLELKPMPEKKELNEFKYRMLVNGEQIFSEDIGYNKCIDEILGDNNE